MDPERNGNSHISKTTLRNSESLLINNSFGLYKDGPRGLCVIDNQTSIPKALNSCDKIQTAKIGNFNISHSITKSGEILIAIESDAVISALKCSYRFPFEKKFAYEKAKREAESGAT